MMIKDNRETIKISKKKTLDDTLFVWLSAERERGVPIREKLKKKHSI